MNAEIWQDLETMKVEPGVVHETYSAPVFEENELTEVRDVGCPISITFPVVKTEIQQEELWDFNAMTDVASEVKDEECVFSLEELRVVQDKRVCCVTAQLNTDSQNKPHDSIDNEDGTSDCVFVGQERYKQKLRRTHPGETSLGSDTHNKCLSEETNLITRSGTQRRKKLHYCQSCAIVFPSYYSLLHHSCIQNREGGFKCSICNEWFCEKQTLAVHVLVHSGTLSFSRWSKAINM